MFLEYLDLTEQQFNEIAVSQIIYPNECDPAELERGKEVWDQKLWYRERQKTSVLKDTFATPAAMDKAAAEKQTARKISGGD